MSEVMKVDQSSNTLHTLTPLSAIHPTSQEKFVLSSNHIQTRLKELSLTILDHHPSADTPLLIMGIAMGALNLWSDLRAYLQPSLPNLSSALIHYRRYRSGTTADDNPNNKPYIIGLDHKPLPTTPILVLDDLLDQGQTMSIIVDWMSKMYPDNPCQTLALLDKQKKGYQTHHVGFYLDASEHDPWVVGYGIDYKGLYRGLDDIMQIKQAQHHA
jgi:hypoxanthine phosphoribosyltransferase